VGLTAGDIYHGGSIMHQPVRLTKETAHDE
jgi:hypothetical protein